MSHKGNRQNAVSAPEGTGREVTGPETTCGRLFPWLLFAEALVFLYLARVMFLFLPFKRCLRLLKVPRGTDRSAPRPELLFHIRHAVRRANKFALWKNKCLVMSATARWMLNRRNIASTMYFGVKTDESNPKKLSAHAWITSNQTELVKKNGDYRVMLKV